MLQINEIIVIVNTRIRRPVKIFTICFQIYLKAINFIHRRAFPGLCARNQTRQKRTSLGSNVGSIPYKMSRTYSGPFVAKETWTHDFCLLSSPTAQKTPTNVEMDQLRKAGLGKRKIVFPNKDADHYGLVKHLEAGYPKLKSGGGFELLKGVGGGSGARSLESLPLGPNGYSIRYLRETLCIGQAVLYIKPLQVELDMTPGEVNYVCYIKFLFCFVFYW